MEKTAMFIGRTGLWSVELRTQNPPEVHDVAAELDQHGWGALWIPGLAGGDILGDAERLLRATSNAAVATGVLGIWGYPASDMAAGHARLRHTYGPRFMLGLGVSDAASARKTGGVYRPLAAMDAYLDQLDQAPDPVPADERIVAAMGPKLTELAGRRSAGTHPFLVTPEFIAEARTLLGPKALLSPYQAVVLSTDADHARNTARGFLAPAFTMSHYARSLLRQGFTEDDLADGGSNRLIDAFVAWGDVDTIAERIRAQHDAGADHVALHVISGRSGFPLREWQDLAPLAH
jgi:probable F420-dependent oxidoreductase